MIIPAMDTPPLDSLNVNGVCLPCTAFHVLSTERISRARTPRRCLIYDMCVLCSRSLLGCVSWAQVELLDTGSAADLLTPLPLANRQSAKRWWEMGPSSHSQGDKKLLGFVAGVLCKWGVCMIWGVLLTLPKKMSWGADPKASEPWHVSKPC